VLDEIEALLGLVLKNEPGNFPRTFAWRARAPVASRQPQHGSAICSDDRALQAALADLGTMAGQTSREKADIALVPRAGQHLIGDATWYGGDQAGRFRGIRQARRL
jgi:hypothetical protein